MKRKKLVVWAVVVAMAVSLIGSMLVTANAKTAGVQKSEQSATLSGERDKAQNGTELTQKEKASVLKKMEAKGTANTANAGKTKSGQKSVTVYFTLSEDGEFVTGKDRNQTVLSRVPVTIDYFDLKEYGLQDFYRYEADAPEEGGQYTGDKVIEQPTLLHLYIKMLEKYYLDGKRLEVGGDALTIQGGATSMYMKQFWGHDENLMYYVDHQYPLMQAGWGATADYILLEDEMEIDVAMFSDWNFYTSGAFASFNPTAKTVKTGEQFQLTMNGSSTNGVSGGNTGEACPMEGEDIVYADMDDAKGAYTNAHWTKWKDKTDSNGKVTMSFDEPGTYLISSTPLYQTFKNEDNTPCVAPPAACIKVTGNGGEEDDSGTENLTVLSNLYFTDGTAESAQKYQMTPAFHADTGAYTVFVPDSQKTVALWSEKTPEAGAVSAASKIKAVYTDIDGAVQEKIKKAGESSGLSLAGLLQEGGRGAAVKVTASCGKSSQEYTVNIKRIPTLAAMSIEDAEGNALSVAPEFNGSRTDYTLKIPEELTKVNLTLKPRDETYTLSINGKAAESGKRTEVSIDSAPQTIEIVVAGKESSTTYKIKVEAKKRISCTFNNLVSNTIVQVLDSQQNDLFKGKAEGSSCTVEKLLEGESYTWRLSKKGYQGKSGTIEVGKTNLTIDGALIKAQENTGIDSSITSRWPNFRGNADNNGVTTYKAPTKAADAELLWAVKNGDGWSGAPSSPIFVGNDLVFSTNSELVKVDRVTGEVKQRSNMVSKSVFSLTPPTYADGMIFIALAGGKVQAFNAKTLKSLWVYQDPLKGQPNSPITYHNGYLYTGFWNSQEANADYVCLSATDENPGKETEAKTPTWTQAHKGGFYWAGAYASDNFVLVGAENGTSDEKQESGSLYSFDPETGVILDKIDNIRGDIRCTIVYDKDTNQYCFTSKGGMFYSIKTGANGKFDRGSLKSIELSSLKKDTGAGSSSEDTGGQSNSTPVVYNGRAYVGVSGTKNLGAYSGHSMAVIDLGSGKIAYQAETRGYPQTSGLLTTAYEKDGYNYIYFIENYTPGIVRVLKDKKGQTAPIFDPSNNGIIGENSEFADTLFTPRGEQAEYAICSPIVDEYGTIYFKNDSSYMMALGSRIDSLKITKMPDKTEYDAGEKFDPKGMVVTAYLANGLTRDVTDYVSYSTQPLTEQDLEIEISYKHVMYNDKAKKIDPPAAYISISSASEAERVKIRETTALIDEITGAEKKEEAVKKARAAYDALGAKLQKYVKNKEILVKAETEIAKGKLTAKPSLKVAATSYNTLKLTWSRIANAEGYEIYRSTSSSSRGTKIKTMKGNTTTSLSNGSLTTGTTYYYTVRPYILVDGSPVGDQYSAMVKGKTSLPSMRIKASAAGYSTIKLTWSAVSGASGYQIYRSTSSTKGFKLIKNLNRGSDSSYTNSSLYTGTKYYYKIRAYRGSAYSSYSSVAYATPKLSTPSKFKVKAGKRKASVSWKRVSGASGYVVYRSTKSKGRYKAVKTIKKSSTVKYTNSKLKKGKIYYYKTRAYRVVKGKKVYSSYTKAIKAKIR